MANSYDSVTVHDTATEVIANLTSFRSILIKNNGSQIIYLGFDDQVDSSTGFSLNPQDTLELAGLHIGRKSALYAISASGDQDVRYLAWDN